MSCIDAALRRRKVGPQSADPTQPLASDLQHRLGRELDQFEPSPENVKALLLQGAKITPTLIQQALEQQRKATPYNQDAWNKVCGCFFEVGKKIK